MGNCISRQEDPINTPNYKDTIKNTPNSFQKTFATRDSSVTPNHNHGKNFHQDPLVNKNSNSHHVNSRNQKNQTKMGNANLKQKPSNAKHHTSHLNHVNNSNHSGPPSNHGSDSRHTTGSGLNNSNSLNNTNTNTTTVNTKSNHTNPNSSTSNNNNNNSNTNNINNYNGNILSNAHNLASKQLGTNSAPWDTIAGSNNLHNPARSIPSFSNHSNNTNNTNNQSGNRSGSGLANSNNRYTSHNRNSNTANASNHNTAASQTSSKTPSQASSTDRIFVALYDYAARTDADLSFRRGDKMEILDRSGGGWWMAKHMDPQAILNRGEIRDRGYVPSNFIAKYKTLESYDWYFGQIRRNEAERTLMNPINEHGTFLIRKAETRAGEFSLSLRDNIRIKHYRIRTLDQGGFFIAQNTPFQTLPDLIEHYKENSDGLCCRLSKPARKVEMAPMTHGLSHDTVEQYEVPKESFQKISKLGGGNFGDVYEGLWNGSTKVAIKCLKGSNVNPDEFMAEAEHMRKLGTHKRLMPLYAVVREPNQYWIITELMKYGSLLHYLKDNPASRTLKLDTLVDIGAQVADGMSFLECQSYVHRDLAARNVLVGEHNKIKVGDFGLARVLEKNDMYTAKEGAKIPIKWTAPEAVNYNKFTVKSDIWSFGILLAEIITKGRTPYPGMSNAEVLEAVSEKNYRMPQMDGCPDALYNIMLECWNKNPDKRPSFESLKWRLDEFFSQDDDYREAELHHR